MRMQLLHPAYVGPTLEAAGGALYAEALSLILSPWMEQATPAAMLSKRRCPANWREATTTATLRETAGRRQTVGNGHEDWFNQISDEAADLALRVITPIVCHNGQREAQHGMGTFLQAGEKKLLVTMPSGWC